MTHLVNRIAIAIIAAYLTFVAGKYLGAHYVETSHSQQCVDEMTHDAKFDLKNGRPITWGCPNTSREESADAALLWYVAVVAGLAMFWVELPKGSGDVDAKTD